MGPVLIAVVMLLGLALIGFGAALEARSRPRGGQRLVRNAPPMPRRDRIPGPPPRGNSRNRS